MDRMKKFHKFSFIIRIRFNGEQEKKRNDFDRLS